MGRSTTHVAALAADDRTMETVEGRTVEASTPSTSAARAFLGIGAIVCAVVAVSGEPLRGWVFLTPLLGAVVASALAVRRDPSPANPTWFLLAGAVLLVPGYVLWYPAKVQWHLQLGDPAITDWFFLAAYAAFTAALARLIRRRAGDDRRIHLLDSLIISVGVGVLVWVFLLSPYLHSDGMSWPARLVAASYIVVDVLLLGAMTRLVVEGRIASTGDRLLMAWVVTQLAADIVYFVTSLQGTFRLSNGAPILYCGSFVLLGAALLHPSTMRAVPSSHIDRPVSGRRRIALLGSAALIAPVVLVDRGIEGKSEDVPVVALMAAVLFALVLWRVWLLMVDVQEHRRIQDRLTASIQMERRRAQENQELLASLRERQMLAERLFRIQRKISTRAPLQDVLDAVTQGAAELMRDDVVGLRLIDENDPAVMVMVSSVGVAPADAETLHRLPVTAGVGGQALVENRLCIQEDYSEWDGAIGAFAAGGLRSAMGAPVHVEGEPIGSLVVASHQPGRRYSKAEQDALIAFAEHVSIALNDAQAVASMHHALDQAVHQAMHDELTGLPNRACFYDRTEQALRSARRDGSSTAVLLFDLDRFKEINDTLGHRYGDRVLRAIGGRIAPLLRDADTLARLGGDEFCVLLPHVESIGAATDVARRITEALEEPFELEGMNMVVEASCGVAVAPAHGDTADILLQRSDVAMYVSKTSHVSVVAYEDRLDRNTPDRLALLGDLRSAIATDQLVLHFQPQADLHTGVIEGVEALVRWQHPRLGLVGPDDFIPIAEDTGLIRPLTTWVLDAALDQLRRWMDDPAVDTGPELSIGVNLSTRSLLDDSIRDEVVIALERFGVPAHQLVLEITETAIMADPGRAHRVLAELAAVGVRFAIDDFGTGYSSLASLKTLPVHHLKIDKSFVRDMHENPNDATIVRSVIDLGRTLGLRTVAEGVERTEVWEQLAELGCDAAQGYLLARPMPGPQLGTWITARRRGRLRTVVG
jgi:diguanylate cyclase (GGDEF)-like protein